jgi:hypothetical protein
MRISLISSEWESYRNRLARSQPVGSGGDGVLTLYDTYKTYLIGSTGLVGTQAIVRQATKS